MSGDAQAREWRSSDREFSRALLESMADGVVACDAHGVLTLFNRVAREWHGADPMRLPREEWPQHYNLYRSDGVTPLPADEVPLARAYRGETVIDEGMAIAAVGQPVRFILANGSVITDAAGNKLGAVVVMRDVTQLRRVEAELRAANESLEAHVAERTAELQQQFLLLRGIVDSAAVPIFSVDRQYRYTSFNAVHAAAMRQLYGTDIAIGHSLLECMTVPQDREVARRNLDRVLAGESHTHEGYSGASLRSRQYFRIAHNPITNGAGEVLGAAVVAHDLTDRKRAEDAQRASLEFLEGLDRVNRAIQGACDLEHMMESVLDVVLELFGCDRAFLLHPCDPTAASWACPMERTRPEYPGVGVLGVVVPMDAQVAETLRTLLAADGPVWFGPGGDQPLPADASERFGFKSLLSTAVHPRLGGPWQFGLHQCSAVRHWTAAEVGLLREIGRRLADGLTSLLMHRDLQQSEASYRQIVATASEGIWVLGPAAETRFVNARMAAMLGYTVEEMVGRAASDFVLDDDLADHQLRMENRQNGVSETYERRYRRKDGSVFWGIAAAVPTFDEKGGFTGSFAMLTDITERKQAEHALRRLNRELRAISECNQVLVRAEDEQTLLDDICRIVCDMAGYCLAWVGFVEHDEARSIRPVAWAGLGSGYIARLTLSWSEAEEQGRGPAGRCVREGRTIQVQDFTTDPLMAPWREAALLRGYRSGVAMPLKDDHGGVFGVLLIYAAEPNAISADEARLLEELAGDLAFGITVLRGRTRQRLAERSAALLGFALDQVSEASFLVDEDGRIRDVNQEACRALGYSREELLGMQVVDLDPDFSTERWREHWQLLQSKRAMLFESRHRDKSGRMIQVEINANYFEYEGEAYNLALARDITERKAAEAAVRDSARRLAEAQRLAQIGSWELDLGDNVLLWSDEIYRIFEIDPRRFGATYQAFLDAIHPDDRAMVDAAYCASLANRTQYAIDHRLLFPDGRIKHVHEQCKTDFVDGRPSRSYGTVQDITVRKLAEEELRRRESYIRNILDSVDEGILVVDRELRIAAANRAFCASVGLPEAAVVGSRCHETSHGTDRPCCDPDPECPVLRTFASGQVHAAAHVHVDREGSKRQVELKSYPVTDPTGAIVSVIETINDVTERGKLELQLRQAQKMEAIGTLAGGIAHDFNNMLTAIIGYGSLMSDAMAPGDPNRPWLEEVLAAAARAAQLAQDLLAFSRKQVVNPKPVELNAVVHSIDKLLRRLIGEDIELRTETAAVELVVLADAGQLGQVLMNLATNARDAMPRGGVLSIATRAVHHSADRSGAPDAVAPGDYAELTVADTGVGMDETVRTKLFEPFFTTKELGKGTGLGLSIVYGIVKQHGGSIDVCSEPGRGTTFQVLLPLVGEAVEGTGARVAMVPVLGTETILLAEDDASVRGLITTVLRSQGYRVIAAVDGAEAIEQFAAHEADIDMLILDVIMPRLSGREAYEAVRLRRPDVLALFVSGYDDDLIQAKGTLDEHLHFLAKPLDPSELLGRVRAMLDARRR